MKRRAATKIRHKHVSVFAGYGVHVYVGKWADVKTAALKRLRRVGVTGEDPGAPNAAAWRGLPRHDPIIGIRGGRTGVGGIATLAHEASHVMDYISEHLSIDDGEFKAHGIAYIVTAAAGMLRK